MVGTCHAIKLHLNPLNAIRMEKKRKKKNYKKLILRSVYSNILQVVKQLHTAKLITSWQRQPGCLA